MAAGFVQSCCLDESDIITCLSLVSGCLLPAAIVSFVFQLGSPFISAAITVRWHTTSAKTRYGGENF